MQIILLEKVANLGNLGDQTKVKSGYARNFLIPYGKAIRATTENSAKFAARRAELELAAKKVLEEAQARAEQLKEVVFEIAAKASDEGKLFGSVGTRQIADAIHAKGIKVEKSDISLPNGVIRQTGEHDITVLLHSDVRVEIKLKITQE